MQEAGEPDELVFLVVCGLSRRFARVTLPRLLVEREHFKVVHHLWNSG